MKILFMIWANRSDGAQKWSCAEDMSPPPSIYNGSYTPRMPLCLCFCLAVAIATTRVQTQNNLLTKTYILPLDVNCSKWDWDGLNSSSRRCCTPTSWFLRYRLRSRFEWFALMHFAITVVVPGKLIDVWFFCTENMIATHKAVSFSFFPHSFQLFSQLS